MKVKPLDEEVDGAAKIGLYNIGTLATDVGETFSRSFPVRKIYSSY